MTDAGEPRFSAVFGWLALFVVLGALPVYLVWSFVNQLLIGRLEAGRAGLALIGLLILVGLLYAVVGRIGRWERETEPGPSRPEGAPSPTPHSKGKARHDG